MLIGTSDTPHQRNTGAGVAARSLRRTPRPMRCDGHVHIVGASKTFAIGLGRDIRHANRLIYSKGLDLTDPEAATPIGVGCKECERPNCPQRAFPPIGRRLDINEGRSAFAPYSAT